jgi:hypothetical protein
MLLRVEKGYPQGLKHALPLLAARLKRLRENGRIGDLGG